MSKTLNAIRKRQKWPVKVGDDTVYVRALTKGEQRQSREIEDMEQRAAFIFGIALIEDDGSPSFPRNDGESAGDFAKRVDAELDDVPEDAKAEILKQLAKVHSADVEKIAKN